MKLFKYIILSVAVTMFASCETDLETVRISNPDDFVAPVLKGEYSDITVTAENAKTGSIEFKWSAADFGLPTEVLYSVYLSCGDKSALLGQKKDTEATFSYEDINSVALSGLEIAPNATGSVTAYVTAKMAGTDNYEPIASAKSNSFNVTTYEVPVKAMYLVGEINGWNNQEGAALEIWETKGGSNTYEGIYNFVNKDDASDTDCGFQILPTAGSWDGQMGYGSFDTHRLTGFQPAFSGSAASSETMPNRRSYSPTKARSGSAEVRASAAAKRSSSVSSMLTGGKFCSTRSSCACTSLATKMPRSVM